MTIAHHPPTGFDPATDPAPAPEAVRGDGPLAAQDSNDRTTLGLLEWDERRSLPLTPEVEVLVRRLDPQLPLPAYAHASDAGADLVAAEDVTLAPGERAVVGTGLGIALPEGYAAFVHPRSGLAARYGVTVVNAPGTVDAGYRGEIKVILANTGRDETVLLRRGDRIAQLVVQRVEHAVFREVDELPDTVRGSGGFGSTGGFTVAGAVPASAPARGAGGTAGNQNTADIGDIGDTRYIKNTEGIRDVGDVAGKGADGGKERG